MNTKTLNKVCILSSILIGWNVFLVVIFLTLIGISVLLSSLGIEVIFKDSLFYLEVFIASLISIASGTLVGKISLKWLCKQKQTTILISLSFLVAITVIMFPSTFSYVDNLDADKESSYIK